MHKLRQPTEKQIKLAKSIGISVEGKSFRVISAEISDKIELDSFEYVSQKNIKCGIKVKYIGQRSDMPKNLIVSSIGKNGFVYFKKTLKYCRPWDIEV